MKELENFLSAEKIDEKYHQSIFYESQFENIHTQISFKEFEKIRNQIYWLSLTIYRISFVNYFKNIDDDWQNISENNFRLRKNNILVFHPITNFSSEICKQFKNNSIYPSIISMLCRQIIEQICLIKEIEREKIDEKKIVEASIESYNCQINAGYLNIESLNNKNKGLLKVFKEKISYGKLVNKYNYGFMYNFFSGDIHTLSQIEKLIPFSSKSNKEYYRIYFECVLSLLKDLIFLLEEYNEYVEFNLDNLNKFDFIDIKSNRKK